MGRDARNTGLPIPTAPRKRRSDLAASDKVDGLPSVDLGDYGLRMGLSPPDCILSAGYPRSADQSAATASLSCVFVSKSPASWRSCNWVEGSPETRLTMRPRLTAGRLAIWSVQRCTFL